MKSISNMPCDSCEPLDCQQYLLLRITIVLIYCMDKYLNLKALVFGVCTVNKFWQNTL